jgi:surfeit locus 1 family protein
MTDRRSRLLLTLFTLAGVILLSALGFWQLERKQWKEGVLARLTTRLAAPARPLPPPAEWRRLVAEDHEYERYAVRGVFERDREALIMRPSGKVAGAPSQPGYWVMAPLRLDDGSRVLVNRGFIPLDRRDARRDTPDGAVTVTGALRLPEPRGLFTPADDPAKGQWFTRDPAAIAAALQLENAAPFSIDEDAHGAPPGAPAGGATVVDIPNNHLSYALTWFGLAATLMGVFLAFRLRPGAGT